MFEGPPTGVDNTLVVSGMRMMGSPLLYGKLTVYLPRSRQAIGESRESCPGEGDDRKPPMQGAGKRRWLATLKLKIEVIGLEDCEEGEVVGKRHEYGPRKRNVVKGQRREGVSKCREHLNLVREV